MHVPERPGDQQRGCLASDEDKSGYRPGMTRPKGVLTELLTEQTG
jgi:hypothetical protein